MVVAGLHRRRAGGRVGGLHVHQVVLRDVAERVAVLHQGERGVRLAGGLLAVGQALAAAGDLEAGGAHGEAKLLAGVVAGVVSAARVGGGLAVVGPAAGEVQQRQVEEGGGAPAAVAVEGGGVVLAPADVHAEVQAGREAAHGEEPAGVGGVVAGGDGPRARALVERAVGEALGVLVGQGGGTGERVVGHGDQFQRGVQGTGQQAVQVHRRHGLARARGGEVAAGAGGGGVPEEAVGAVQHAQLLALGGEAGVVLGGGEAVLGHGEQLAGGQHAEVGLTDLEAQGVAVGEEALARGALAGPRETAAADEVQVQRELLVHREAAAVGVAIEEGVDRHLVGADAEVAQDRLKAQLRLVGLFEGVVVHARHRAGEGARGQVGEQARARGPAAGVERGLAGPQRAVVLQGQALGLGEVQGGLRLGDGLREQEREGQGGRAASHRVNAPSGQLRVRRTRCSRRSSQASSMSRSSR